MSDPMVPVQSKTQMDKLSATMSAAWGQAAFHGEGNVSILPCGP
jgi:hypothetical protein